MNTYTKHHKQAEVWVSEYYLPIYRYCYLKTSNTALAQDLTQEVFCRFFQRMERYHKEKKIKQILFMIAHNLCVDHYRKSNTKLQELAQNQLDLTPKRDVERNIAIQTMMNQLSAPLKETLILHYYYEFKIKEIAVIMNTSSSNVKYRMKKGKEEMKRLLQKEGMEYDEWF